MTSTTAAALMIGNELLTGKVVDENLPFLARELFALGILLERAIVCPDEMSTIARDLNSLRHNHGLVFTSGGVGPTHDDITIDAVAQAFDRPLVRSPELESLIRQHRRKRSDQPVTEGHLRMANMPEGAELVRSGELPWPTLRVDNVYILPGVPEAFRMKFASLRDRIDPHAPFHCVSVYTWCDEGDIAEQLTNLTQLYPDVTIGSYVRWNHPDHKVKITFDSKDKNAANASANAFITVIPNNKFIRRDP